jgi:hypothetical protein
MNKDNIEYINNHVDRISKLSFKLINKIKKDDVDIYMDAYNINQEAHKLRKMLDNCKIA